MLHIIVWKYSAIDEINTSYWNQNKGNQLMTFVLAGVFKASDLVTISHYWTETRYRTDLLAGLQFDQLTPVCPK